VEEWPDGRDDGTESTRVRGRRLALVAVAVVMVLCVVGVSIAAVAAGGQSIAYSVNGTKVSQKSFDDQLDELASNDATKKQASQTEGSVTSTVGAQLMNLNILHDLLRDAAEKQRVGLTNADRSAGVSAAKTQLGQNYASAPKGYRNLLADLFAYVHALGLTSSTLDAFLGKQARAADIYVNPRYGQWRPARGGVCPPSGCSATG
jgi:hypothetical protein